MASVKIPCPKCSGFGLTGAVVETVCTQCNGTGTITVSDASTLATLNTTAASTGTAIVVTAAVAPPAVALKAAVRGK